MCDKAVDACLPQLKFVPDWIVTKKILKDLDNNVSFSDDIVFVNADSDITFLVIIWVFLIISAQMMTVSTMMIKALLFMLDLWLGVTYMNNAKKEKEINKELILVAWHSTRC